MKRGQIPDDKVPAGERLKIVVDRQLNLADNKQNHPPEALAAMMLRNELALNHIFQEAWGGTFL